MSKKKKQFQREREAIERQRAPIEQAGQKKTGNKALIGVVILAIAAILIYQSRANSLPDGTASQNQNLITAQSSPTPAASSQSQTGDQAPTSGRKCRDGSAMTITGRSGDTMAYRCESGAEGSYGCYVDDCKGELQ